MFHTDLLQAGTLRPLGIITRQHFRTGWSRPEVKTDFESWQTMPRSAERGQSISSFLARDRDVCSAACAPSRSLGENIIPPSPRPLRGRAERRWGERNLLLAVPLSKGRGIRIIRSPWLDVGRWAGHGNALQLHFRWLTPSHLHSTRRVERGHLKQHDTFVLNLEGTKSLTYLPTTESFV